MVIVMFIASVLATGFVLSLVPEEPEIRIFDGSDYHFVPYAGDAFGA